MIDTCQDPTENPAFPHFTNLTQGVSLVTRTNLWRCHLQRCSLICLKPERCCQLNSGAVILHIELLCKKTQLNHYLLLREWDNSLSAKHTCECVRGPSGKIDWKQPFSDLGERECERSVAYRNHTHDLNSWTSVRDAFKPKSLSLGFRCDSKKKLTLWQSDHTSKWRSNTADDWSVSDSCGH